MLQPVSSVKVLPEAMNNRSELCMHIMPLAAEPGDNRSPGRFAVSVGGFNNYQNLTSISHPPEQHYL